MSAVDTWMPRAKCRWIPGFTEAPIPEQVAFCQDCPVKRECMQYGIDTGSSTIVFGGKKFKSKGGRT